MVEGGLRTAYGYYGERTVSQFREQVEIIRGQVRQGIDPKAKRNLSTEGVPTLKEFLVGEYVELYRLDAPESCDDTIKNLKRNFLAEYGRTPVDKYGKPLDFSDIPLDEITKAQIHKWRALRSKMTKVQGVGDDALSVPIKPYTVNKNVSQLSTLLAKAAELGYLKVNPLVGLKKLKESGGAKDHVRFLTKEEYSQLIKTLDAREARKKGERERTNSWRAKRHKPLLPNFNALAFVDHVKPMILLSLASGVRIGSLAKLRWGKHVKLEGDTVSILLTSDIVKNDKRHEIPLDQYTSDVMHAWHKQGKDSSAGNNWVFPGKKPGTHIKNCRTAWRNILTAAGIEEFRWHDLRHDFASQHVMSGTDLYTVMELMGHSDPKMTKRYAHLAKEHKELAAAKLSERRQSMLHEAKESE